MTDKILYAPVATDHKYQIRPFPDPEKEPAGLNDNDPDKPYKDSVCQAAESLLAHWDDVGLEGLDDYIEELRTALAPAKRCRYPNCDLVNCGDCDRATVTLHEGGKP